MTRYLPLLLALMMPVGIGGLAVVNTDRLGWPTAGCLVLFAVGLAALLCDGYHPDPA